MLTREQVQSYRRDGYLLVENVLSARELATLRQVTDELVAASHAVTEHNHVYDLEPTHTPRRRASAGSRSRTTCIRPSGTSRSAGRSRTS